MVRTWFDIGTSGFPSYGSKVHDTLFIVNINLYINHNLYLEGRVSCTKYLIYQQWVPLTATLGAVWLPMELLGSSIPTLSDR